MPENILQPMYNNEDEICGIISGDIPYYFVKNLQGDIIAITDHNGEVVARYSYDAWGVPTVTCMSGCSIGNENPFRYRGYYYDTETNLYYLQSRYYDANIGRFVNGDEAEFSVIIYGVLTHNAYSYCKNNILMYVDKKGYWAERYGGFYIVNDGFVVNVHPDFLSSTFCYSYAADIYCRYRKTSSAIRRMTTLRMAAEIYAHAMAYYFGPILARIGIERGNAYAKEGKYVHVNYNDRWAYKYWIIWGISRIVKILLLKVLVGVPILWYLVWIYM